MSAPDVPAVQKGFGARLERRLESRLWLPVLLFIVAGFVLRILAALPSFLNPDEVLNFLSANQLTLRGAVNVGMTNPHPPLYYILLWFWRMLGTSDVMLRLPSVLAGTAGLWFAWRWLTGISGRAAGLIGLAVLAFAPEMVHQSAEVRVYALQFLLMAAALHSAEQAFDLGSWWRALLVGLLAALAVAAHYSSLWFALALGVYVTIRLLLSLARAGARSPLPRPAARTVLAWLVGQAVCAGTGLWLYLVHIRKLTGGPLDAYARNTWLADSYFRAGQDNLFRFVIERLVSVFGYLFSSPAIGVVALVLFVCGLAVLAFRRARRTGRRRWDVSVLLLVLFAVAIAAAVLGFYPFGPTRHSVYLALFAVAGVAMSLSLLAGRRLLPALAAVVVLMPVWYFTTRSTDTQYSATGDWRRGLMTEAVEHIRDILPQNRIVFSGYQSQILLKRYLCGRDTAARYGADFVETDCAGYRLVRPASAWLMDVDNFGGQFRWLTERESLDIGEPVCVVSAGWDRNLAVDLAAGSGARYPGMKLFGRHIGVLLLPALGGVFDSLAAVAQSEFDHPFRTVLWPTHLLDDSTPVRTRGLADDLLTYSRFYELISPDPGQVTAYLPALAFWEFFPTETHPRFMQYMSERESYATGNLLFNLVAADTLGVAGVYIITEGSPE